MAVIIRFPKLTFGWVMLTMSSLSPASL